MAKKRKRMSTMTKKRISNALKGRRLSRKHKMAISKGVKRANKRRR